MDEKTINSMIYSTVKNDCDQLTDMELAKLNNFAQQGLDPSKQTWYGKVSNLFTENGGKKMHDATLDALASVVLSRLS